MPDEQEGPLFTKRATAIELVKYFAENGLPCTSESFRGHGQVGRLRFECKALASLFRTGRASVQGAHTPEQDQGIRQLLRVALWEVKTAKVRGKGAK